MNVPLENLLSLVYEVQLFDQWVPFVKQTILVTYYHSLPIRITYDIIAIINK